MLKGKCWGGVSPSYTRAGRDHIIAVVGECCTCAHGSGIVKGVSSCKTGFVPHPVLLQSWTRTGGGDQGELWLAEQQGCAKLVLKRSGGQIQVHLVCQLVVLLQRCMSDARS